MVHLVVHLLREAELGGPIQNYWMYQMERTLGKCKRRVQNKARSEASIAEAYLVDECLRFISRILMGLRQDGAVKSEMLATIWKNRNKTCSLSEFDRWLRQNI